MNFSKHTYLPICNAYFGQSDVVGQKLQIVSLSYTSAENDHNSLTQIEIFNTKIGEVQPQGGRGSHWCKG